MFGKNKKFLGNNIPHSCDYCQNCVVMSGKNFCRYKKAINKKGKCSKFDYNPILRKVSPPQILEKHEAAEFSL